MAGQCPSRTVVKAALLLLLIFKLCTTSALSQPGATTQTKIGNSIGLIVLNKKNSAKGFIHLYNQDGSLWHKFSFYYDQSGDQYPYAKKDFAPFAFHPSYFVLALKCVRKVGGRYQVVVNEESGLKKYVMANDPLLVYETWEAHVLRAFAVEFDKTRNSLRKTKQGAISKVSTTKEDVFHPVKIEGDWLLLERDIGGAQKARDFGWVKWKEKRQLLIYLFYFA